MISCCVCPAAGGAGEQLHPAREDGGVIPSVQRPAERHERREGPGDPEAAGEKTATNKRLVYIYLTPY